MGDDLKTFAELTTQRAIVALVPYIDGEALIVATTNDLFEVDMTKKRVTLLTFRRKSFGELVDRPIVGMGVLHQNHTIYVATDRDLFEANLVTRNVTLLHFWPTVNFQQGPIPSEVEWRSRAYQAPQ